MSETKYKKRSLGGMGFEVGNRVIDTRDSKVHGTVVKSWRPQFKFAIKWDDGREFGYSDYEFDNFIMTPHKDGKV